MAIVDVEHARDLAACCGRALGVTLWRILPIMDERTP
jgi:hypothetical protein